MGIINQARQDENRARMRLARKLSNGGVFHGTPGPAYDNTQAGASPPSRLKYDQAIEAKVPQARGASFAASVVGQSDYKSPTDDVSQRVDMGRALLAKKFVGGDLTKGGDSKTRRKIRDAQRYAQFIDAAAKG